MDDEMAYTREVARERGAEIRIPEEHWVIGVLSLSEFAGSGFLCACLALAWAGRGGHPAVIEAGKASLYESMGLEKTFGSRGFFDFPMAVAQRRPLRGIRNLKNGVNWALRLPCGIENHTAEEFLRLSGRVEGDLVFCRLTGMPEERLKQAAASVDLLLLVVDPLPSRLLPARERYGQILNWGPPVLRVVNRFNGGVPRRELTRFLQADKLLFCPLIEGEAIYSAEYSCRCPYEIPEIRQELDGPLEAVLDEIFLKLSQESQTKPLFFL